MILKHATAPLAHRTAMLSSEGVAALGGDAFGPGEPGSIRLSLVIPEAELRHALP